MKGKYKLQKMAVPGAFIPTTGKKGECALCEYTLTETEIPGTYYCEDCHAVYIKQDNGLLNYVGRLTRNECNELCSL